ncbi:CMRF35-like molecule 1 [Garra rufa]|uniref:CMRF35-like molecule 1 n=1 Tax=Garra rufa TaxID=137080 RepID=UPI003CCEDCD2
MFSMWDVLFLFCSICTVVVGAPKPVTGYKGKRLDIECSYKTEYESNSKYFCKGECNYGHNKNKIVESDSPAKDVRFSLTDNKTAGVFTVTITDLRTEDKGQYWCGVEGRIYDGYSEILLLVKHGNSFTTTPSYSSTTEVNPQSTSIKVTENKETTTDQHTSSTDLASVAGGLGSVLLVLILCSGTFLILRKRKRKSGTALFQQNVQNNTVTDLMYEEIPNQTPASHLNTRPQISTVYATVTNQQPESNPRHTHLTNQVTDTDCDYYANMNSLELTPDSRTEMIYSKVTHPQNIKTNDGPVYYSVIQHK